MPGEGIDFYPVLLLFGCLDRIAIYWSSTLMRTSKNQRWISQLWTFKLTFTNQITVPWKNELFLKPASFWG